jgi:hypothetical protein
MEGIGKALMSQNPLKGNPSKIVYRALLRTFNK